MTSLKCAVLEKCSLGLDRKSMQYSCRVYGNVCGIFYHVEACMNLREEGSETTNQLHNCCIKLKRPRVHRGICFAFSTKNILCRVSHSRDYTVLRLVSLSQAYTLLIINALDVFMFLMKRPIQSSCNHLVSDFISKMELIFAKVPILKFIDRTRYTFVTF